MLRPDMYRKNIFDIDYDLLKKNNIKLLLFDLDNTLIDNIELVFNEKTKQLLTTIKKDFEVAIISNTLRNLKVYNIKKDYNIEIITCSMKPFGKGFRRLNLIKKYNPNEICMIGDQLLTDVLSAKRKGYYSIFLDQISKDIEPITRFSRHFEKRILKFNNIIKGEYY